MLWSRVEGLLHDVHQRLVICLYYEVPVYVVSVLIFLHANFTAKHSFSIFEYLYSVSVMALDAKLITLPSCMPAAPSPCCEASIAGQGDWFLDIIIGECGGISDFLYNVNKCLVMGHIPLPNMVVQARHLVAEVWFTIPI